MLGSSFVRRRNIATTSSWKTSKPTAAFVVVGVVPNDKMMKHNNRVRSSSSLSMLISPLPLSSLSWPASVSSPLFLHHNKELRKSGQIRQSSILFFDHKNKHNNAYCLTRYLSTSKTTSSSKLLDSNQSNINDNSENNDIDKSISTKANSATTTITASSFDDDEVEFDDDDERHDDDDDVEDDYFGEVNTNNSDDTINSYSSDYHVPVMWKECIIALLQCQRGLLRQQQYQQSKNLHPITTAMDGSNAIISSSIGSSGDILDDSNNDTTSPDGPKSLTENQMNRLKFKMKKLNKKMKKEQEFFNDQATFQLFNNTNNQTAAMTTTDDASVPPLEAGVDAFDTSTTKSRKNLIFIDGTVGGGGHSNALLEFLQYGDVVFGCDVDPDALRTTSQRLQLYTAPKNIATSSTTRTTSSTGTTNDDPLNDNDDNCLSNRTNNNNSLPTFIPVQSNFCDLSIKKLLQAAYDSGGDELKQHVHSIIHGNDEDDDDDEGNKNSVNENIGVDGILLDLGVSSYQIDTAERGFAYRQDGPLDMRMSSNSSTSKNLTAADICNEMDIDELCRIFQFYGDESRGRAYRIAQSIVDRRPVYTTKDLYDAVAAVVPDFSKFGRRYSRTSTLSRIFQSFRIVVNQEDVVLRTTLQHTAPNILRTGGRLVVLSYHSLEDRMAKQIIRDGMIMDDKNDRRTKKTLHYVEERDMYGNKMNSTKKNGNKNRNRRPFRLVRKRQKAADDEISRNSRARSATLRIGERQ